MFAPSKKVLVYELQCSRVRKHPACIWRMCSFPVDVFTHNMHKPFLASLLGSWAQHSRAEQWQLGLNPDLLINNQVVSTDQMEKKIHFLKGSFSSGWLNGGWGRQCWWPLHQLVAQTHTGNLLVADTHRPPLLYTVISNSGFFFLFMQQSHTAHFNLFQIVGFSRSNSSNAA